MSMNMNMNMNWSRCWKLFKVRLPLSQHYNPNWRFFQGIFRDLVRPASGRRLRLSVDLGLGKGDNYRRFSKFRAYYWHPQILP